MTYFIEVKVQTQKRCPCCDNVRVSYEWAKLKPTEGLPYEFKTRIDALAMANICYGGLDTNIRIVTQ